MQSNSQTKPQNDTFTSLFQKAAQKNNVAQEETTPEFLRRNVGQNVARAAEAFIGMPGGLKKAYTQTRDFFADKLGLPKTEEMNQLLGLQPEKGSWEDTLINPPTAPELRETATKNIAQSLTGDKEYFEPRSESEKKFSEFTTDLSSFFYPGTGQMRMVTRIGAPLAGNLAKEGVKYFGGSDETAEKAKLGFMLATTIAGQSNPQAHAGNMINEAKQMVPQNMTVFSQPLFQNLQNLTQRLGRGLRVPSKSKAAQGIRDLARQADPQGRIPMHSLMDARDNVNEWIAEAGGWDIPGPVRDASIRNLNALKRNIIDTIDTNLQSRLPQAADLYQRGYQASAVVHQSNVISNFIQKHYGKKFASSATKVLFPTVAAGGGLATVVAPKALGAAALFPAYKTGQVLYRVAQSPTLARYYQDVIAAAQARNAPAMIHNMSKLDKALYEEEKKENKLKKPSLEEFKSKFKVGE